MLHNVSCTRATLDRDDCDVSMIDFVNYNDSLMIGTMQEYETSQQQNDSDWFISTSINDYYPEMFAWCIGEYDPIISFDELPIVNNNCWLIDSDPMPLLQSNTDDRFVRIYSPLDEVSRNVNIIIVPLSSSYDTYMHMVSFNDQSMFDDNTRQLSMFEQQQPMMLPAIDEQSMFVENDNTETTKKNKSNGQNRRSNMKTCNAKMNSTKSIVQSQTNAFNSIANAYQLVCYTCGRLFINSTRHRLHMEKCRKCAKCDNYFISDVELKFHFGCKSKQ